jgi:FkbM family methyltransferase
MLQKLTTYYFKEKNMNAIYYPDVPFKSLYIPEILKEIYIDKVFSRLKPCNIIMDVGANIGLTAMYLKDFGKTVYAIEPELRHFEALLQNAITLGENGRDNIEPFHGAISDYTGTEKLFINEENRTMNSLVWQHGISVKVHCWTFAQFMTKNRIEDVDFVKLDVEGAEEKILMGDGFTGVCKCIKSLLVEFHDRSRVDFLLDHMFHLGYKIETVQANALLYWFER